MKENTVCDRTKIKNKKFSGIKGARLMCMTKMRKFIKTLFSQRKGQNKGKPL